MLGMFQEHRKVSETGGEQAGSGVARGDCPSGIEGMVSERREEPGHRVS